MNQLYLHSHFSNVCRRPSIDDPYSYRVSVHLDKRLWRRTLKCEKVTDGGCQVMAKAHRKYCIRFPQNRMKDEQQSVLAPWHVAVFNIGAYLEMNKSFFLRRVSRYQRANKNLLSSFGQAVVEENIKMRKVNGRRTPSDGKSSHFHRQGELKTWWKKKYSYNALTETQYL
jgi:hypothetical protein